jgi:hypothetical protein
MAAALDRSEEADRPRRQRHESKREGHRGSLPPLLCHRSGGKRIPTAAGIAPSKPGDLPLPARVFRSRIDGEMYHRSRTLLPTLSP